MHSQPDDFRKGHIVTLIDRPSDRQADLLTENVITRWPGRIQSLKLMPSSVAMKGHTL